MEFFSEKAKTPLERKKQSWFSKIVPPIAVHGMLNSVLELDAAVFFGCNQDERLVLDEAEKIVLHYLELFLNLEEEEQKAILNQINEDKAGSMEYAKAIDLVKKIVFAVANKKVYGTCLSQEKDTVGGKAIVALSHNQPIGIYSINNILLNESKNPNLLKTIAHELGHVVSIDPHREDKSNRFDDMDFIEELVLRLRRVDY